MLATRIAGTTTVVNAAIEPEVQDLIVVLKKMGARIEIFAPATISITGVQELHPIEHTIMMDRLEAGSLLCAAAITGGSIFLPQADAYAMDVFLEKLSQMGHAIEVGPEGKGVTLTATQNPHAVSFKTGPYPNFPTDLQSPMMAVQCVANGTSVVHELVFENRFHHIEQLKKMGAIIQVEGHKATITGVEQLIGTEVVGSDIRATCALVLAGLVARGTTRVIGVHYLQRAYDGFDQKLRDLGGRVEIFNGDDGNAKSQDRISRQVISPPSLT
jgi:UDP-N-acetylglucosamine 1-carboxyvinyltransferase